MQERTSLEDALSGIGKVERELEDQVGMIELGEAENDAGVVAEAEKALKDLKKEVARRELEALLSGEADKFDSYLEVHAGAGGTESQDWAQMLLRMYTRWAEKRGYKVTITEESEGEQALLVHWTVLIGSWIRRRGIAGDVSPVPSSAIHSSPRPDGRRCKQARAAVKRSGDIDVECAVASCPRAQLNGLKTFLPQLRPPPWLRTMLRCSARTRRAEVRYAGAPADDGAR